MRKSKNNQMQILFNVIGVVTFLGLLIGVLLHELYGEEKAEFIMFFPISLVIYFFLVNIYYYSKWGKQIFYSSLILLFALDLGMIIYCLTNNSCG
ncbi:hypothetical protein LC087_17035 [Bacillus carboniphilus]|uniref:Uncharacterized protein n=1 Tax=Bacillus carboniphilus TaxID=86663 RepID=A0ABY9JSL5_9BACI|nr:hypothetical protein [Bacillus carboniphilus]WLR42386.1 hypothetical protein LC087_17035 [Bacillus carboniphilus]